jgi:NADPH:quinone reductase-like Zn-dependent oxidoreductase
MQVSHFERLGGGPFDPHPLFNSVTIRGAYVGNCTGIGASNRTIFARRLEPVIDSVLRLAEATEAYRYIVDHRHVGKAVISGD